MNKREDMISFLKRYYPKYGWYEDRFGHMQKKTVSDRMQRMKFQARTVRFEIKTSAGWVLQKTFNLSELYNAKFIEAMKENGGSHA